MLLGYLDPGSGSALLGTVFALIGAAAFSLKSLFYRFVLRQKITKAEPCEDIAIFGEGKSYWSTFRPIIDELLKRKIPFSYYTLDVLDPALEIDDPLMYSRLLDKTGYTWTRKFAGIRAKVMLATTPNIGCVGYPLDRPRGVDRLVHVYHDPVGGAGYYMKGGLDRYDDIFMVGAHNEQPIRELEGKRNQSPKKLHLVGSPAVDVYLRELHDIELTDSLRDGRKTILVASSWGDKGLLKAYGCDFVKELLSAGYRVIVRPHPHSYNVEKEFVETCERKCVSWGAEWDRKSVGLESMRISDLLVSDVSGIRFDFAYLFLKPVVSMKIQKGSVESFDASDLNTVFSDTVGNDLGLEIDSSEQVVDASRKLLAQNDFSERMRQWRDAHCANFGASAAIAVDELMSVLKEVNGSLSK